MAICNKSKMKNDAGVEIPVWNLTLDFEERNYLLSLLDLDKIEMEKCHFDARIINAKLIELLSK